ncbi:MAG: hypothetical protein M3Q71_16385 [Chloroflexota bacterium]|nr:hypothetical protein [Chloroflexota bacterium]MDP9472217.1 hypothetical protein [Chloroflexota bacterium]
MPERDFVDDVVDDFEVFDRGSAPKPTHPFVTVQRRGLLSLNRAAHDLLGAPAAVQLLYSRSRNVIGFRAGDPGDPRSYPVRAQGERGGTYLVAGAAFTQHYGIPTTEARRYQARMTGDVLTIDLNEDAPVVTGPRSKDRTEGAGGNGRITAAA